LRRGGARRVKMLRHMDVDFIDNGRAGMADMR
jgi:hypothetical protein